KRRRDRTPNVQSPNSDYPAAAIGDRGSPHNSLCYSVIPTRGFVDLATSYQLQVLPPFQFFDHTGSTPMRLAQNELKTASQYCPWSMNVTSSRPLPRLRSRHHFSEQGDGFLLLLRAWDIALKGRNHPEHPLGHGALQCRWGRFVCAQ